jgi:AsmA-like C-terminal region
MRPGFWRKCRVCFRWCRITVWLVVLAAVCAIVWFNRIGLPDFLKTRLVATLHERGIELAFSRMRLRFERGIVADNVRIGGTQSGTGPVLTVAEVQLQLDFRALLQRRLQVDGLFLRQGKFVWQISPTNALHLDNIQTVLRFQTNDTWTLDKFQADFAGAKLKVSGQIAHAPEIRNWAIFHGSNPANFPNVQVQLQKISDTLDQIHFTGTPQLNLTLGGDTRDIHSCAVRLDVNAAGAQTPWFQARDLQLAANLTAPAGAPTYVDSAWSFWTNLQPYELEWMASGRQLQSEKLNADSVECDGFWRAPELVVTNLSATLGGGELAAGLKLNVATRDFSFTDVSRFDLHAVYALLTEKTIERLADFSWPEPPSLQITGSLKLPVWTNARPDWEGDVRPTVQLNGELSFTNGTMMGARIDSARTHFSYLDLVWQLPDLALTQAKTHLDISGYEDDATRDYRWNIRGVVDPEAARPLLDEKSAHALDIVKLSEPLALDTDVSGRLYDYDSIAVDGRVATTNFTVRGEAFGDVTSAVSYTNRVLVFVKPQMHTGAQLATADSVTLDFNTRLIHFTNIFCIADPEPVARAIGPKTGRLVAPYHFFEPPTARINGQIPLRDMNGGREMADVDMRFDVIKGGPFEWLKLRTTNIVGTLEWRGQTLTLTNLVAAFYGGTADGHAYFDFRVPHEGADYQYVVNVTNVNLHTLALALANPTNHLEGILSGQLVVTNASTEDWRTMSGHGHVDLHDGLLWDIPIISILSPVLNAFSPGLGNSRATEASANFVMTNGLIYSDSLVIHSTMTRLNYVGTIDFHENVNAHVTASLLRDTLVVGPLLSTALWPVSKLFEYHVTGSLKDPKSEPIFVLPKLLLLPLHPIRTLEDLIPDGDSFTNRPSG